jgi:hypothetical protein
MLITIQRRIIIVQIVKRACLLFSTLVEDAQQSRKCPVQLVREPC